MGLADIRDFDEQQFPGGGKLQIPSVGPRDVGQPFRTENGYLVSVEFPVGSTDPAHAFPPQVVRWVEDAFRAVGFDVARLWCIMALWLDDLSNSGEVGEPRFVIRPRAAADIPHFGQDFAYVDPVAIRTGMQTGSYEIHVWDGLAAATPPYGGRRFFMETIHHALGHIVALMLAVGDDPFKRKRICEALCMDRVRSEYSGGSTWGYGFAWQMWDDTWHGAALHTRWDLLPQERFAEAFKDIWCDPQTHTFVNRTRAPRINVQGVIDEGQVYLPINGLDLPPHPGGGFGWRGFSMSARFIDPHSIQVGCASPGQAIVHPCFDPENGDGPAFCVGCHPLANAIRDGTCGTSYTIPLSEGNMDITWSMRLKIPRIGFCRTSRVTYGQPLAFPDIPTRAYDCPGSPGVGADFIGVGFGPDRDPRVIVDGTFLDIQVTRGPLVAVDGMAGPSRHLYAWGTTKLDATFDCHVEPGRTFAGVGVNLFRVEVTGQSALNQAMIREADSFNFMADPFYVAQGYHHFPGLECRHRAPTVGVTYQPYGQLNLDGVDRGSARVPISAGKEGPSVDLDYKGFATVGSGPSLTLEGT